MKSNNKPMRIKRESHACKAIAYDVIEPGCVFESEGELFIAMSTTVGAAFSLKTFEIKPVNLDVLVTPLRSATLTLVD
jgi:hypothetical protein